MDTTCMDGITTMYLHTNTHTTHAHTHTYTTHKTPHTYHTHTHTHHTYTHIHTSHIHTPHTYTHHTYTHTHTQHTHTHHTHTHHTHIYTHHTYTHTDYSSLQMWYILFSCLRANPIACINCRSSRQMEGRSCAWRMPPLWSSYQTWSPCCSTTSEHYLELLLSTSETKNMYFAQYFDISSFTGMCSASMTWPVSVPWCTRMVLLQSVSILERNCWAVHPGTLALKLVVYLFFKKKHF